MSTPTRSHLSATPHHSDQRCGEQAGEYPRRRSRFLAHVAVFAAGVAVIVAVKLFTATGTETTSEWSSWVLIGWALATAEAVGHRQEQAVIGTATRRQRCWTSHPQVEPNGSRGWIQR